jgi:glycosyltransferase involved in cell wall biosynthesis
LTVVMPAYNEEAQIATAVGDIQRHVFPLVPGTELIVIDDGSRDRTGAILDELAATDRRVRVIYQPNGGHGGALRTGLDAAEGEYVLLVDSDRQVPLEAFPALWGAARGRDGAFGVRRGRRDPPFRILLTQLIRLVLRPLCGVGLRDANAPFKVIRREVWREARPLIPPETLAPSLFLAVYARRRGFDVVEVEVPHRARSSGEASLRRWRLVRFSARGLGQLLALRCRLPRRPGVAGRRQVC